MILQKLASAIRHQDWFQVVIEVLIVIVGIFLGLQVQAWYEGKQALVEEGLMVQNFITNLNYNIEFLEQTRMHTEERISEGYTVLRVLEGETLEPEDKAIFENGISRLDKIRPITAYLNTINEDNLNKILNVRLRQTLDRFEGTTYQLSLITLNLHEFLNHTKSSIMGKATVLDYPEREKIAIYDFNSLKNDPEFKASYATVLSRVSDYQSILIRLQENSRTMVSILKQHQAGEILDEVTF